MLKRFKRFVGSTRAQGMVEYILIVALIALLAVVGVRMFGSKLSGMFTKQAEQIETEAGLGEAK